MSELTVARRKEIVLQALEQQQINAYALGLDIRIGRRQHKVTAPLELKLKEIEAAQAELQAELAELETEPA
jgi:hypothetical protein